MIPLVKPRVSGILFSLVLLAAAPLSAQRGSAELSLVFAPGGAYSESEGFELESAYGAGVAFGFGSAWQAEARFLIAEDDTRVESFEQRSFELGLRRGFFDTAPWRPFLQGGVRYREAEVTRQVVCTQFADPCPPLEEQREEIGPFVGGGIDFSLARWFALRFDGRFAFYESDVTDDIEQDVDLTVGLVFWF